MGQNIFFALFGRIINLGLYLLCGTCVSGTTRLYV